MSSSSKWALVAKGKASNIAVVDGVAYVIGPAGRLYRHALASLTPYTKWESWQCVSKPCVTGIVADGTSIYGIGADKRIYAQDVASMSADSKWRHAMRGRAEAISAAEGALYVMGRSPYWLYKWRLHDASGNWEKLLELPKMEQEPLDPTATWKPLCDQQQFPDVVSVSTLAPRDDCIRLVCISDTHGRHRDLDTSSLCGDILIHAGDLTSKGSKHEIEDVANFFHELLEKCAVRHVIVVAGNHDVALEESPGAWPGDRCHYLMDAGARLCGLACYGSPWLPEFSGRAEWAKAFTLPRGEALRTKWMAIPSSLDLLVTHGPPHSKGDLLHNSRRAGCNDLLEAVCRARPRVVVSGHIHEGYGCSFDGHTLFINAASVRRWSYELNDAILVDLPHDKSLPARQVLSSSRVA